MSKYTVHIAGTSARSAQIAEALSADERFDLTLCITPSPKPIGRKQIITQSALAVFASTHTVPTLTVERKIDTAFRTQYEKIERPDILLVVDFGYILPAWMLSYARIAPINIHPSELPKYRGSSPGQFVLLFGEKESAVTLIRMDEKMDHGPIIARLPFAVQPDWMTGNYYDHAFTRVSAHIGDIVASYILQKAETSQPDTSPTVTARMLTKDDGYVPQEGTVPFLAQYNLQDTPQNRYNMYRALSPWPGLWTYQEIKEVKKRVKLTKYSFKDGVLTLEKIQVEGEREKKVDSIE